MAKIAKSSSAIHLTKNSAFITYSHRRILFPTAIVLVKDIFGTLQPYRALLDSCSEVNLITQEAASRLRFEQFKSLQEIAGVSNIRSQLKYKVNATIKSRLSDFEFTTTFLVTKSISSQHPAERMDTDWKIPAHLPLADPQFNVPQRIDLLLSSEIFFEMLQEGKFSMGHDMPHLINTALGWIVGGKIDLKPSIELKSSNTISLCHATTIQELDSLLETFWKIEEFPQHKPTRSEEEEQCESHFSENTVVEPNGRIKVRLPFKYPVSKLGNSLAIARRRFFAIEKRLHKDEMLKNMYVDFMREIIELGHMSIANYEVLDTPHYVIPHHSVLRLQSTSTKLRVVFDASAKTSTNISLNDILMVGPTIQKDLILLIMCFRFHKYTVSADICKMYRQFVVHEEDRNFQLIFWRDNPNKPLNLYRLNTVTYGTSSAPFLATRSLSFIADKNHEQFPIGSQVLKNDLYVDDLLTGTSNVAELLQKRSEITHILEKSGLKLSKWSSNYPHDNMSNDELLFKTNSENITNALGMAWKPNIDVFCFRFEFENNENPTKRRIISIVARIYDVLGFLSPMVTSCKIFIQELWKHQLNWDSPLSDQLKNRWTQIEEKLPYINQIEIPRYVGMHPDEEFEIHGFADASQLAYGCCLYIRTNFSNHHQVRLLIAKSRVAPVVQQSLPRLELCAALLLSRTWEKIKDQFQNKYNYRIYFWSDSKFVLNWLKNHSSSYVCFVANRISEIQNITNNIPWQHVPSKQNPADVVSRGCLADELNATIWLTGPEFRTRGEQFWPKGSISNIELPPSELRKSTFNTTIIENSIMSQIINQQSSYLRILHILVYINRFIYKRNRNSYITPQELQWAFWQVIHDIQQTEFSEEINRLKTGKLLQPSLQKLSPFLQDMQGHNKSLPVLRVGGRLSNSNLPYDSKYPALLPKNHRFTSLYANYLHRKHLHAGRNVFSQFYVNRFG